LFSEKKKDNTYSLKMGKKGDIPSHPVVKQMPCVEEVEVSGCVKTSRSQLYRNCDSFDHKECNMVIKLSEENHVLTIQESQENICTNIGSAQEDLSCEASNLRTTEEEPVKQEMVGLPSKRIRCKPQKLNRDFLW
jgi:hypothetical protein